MPKARAASDSNGAHSRKRPDYEVRGRDHFLRDVDHDMLEQLTELLCMPDNISPSRPPKWWIDDQKNLLNNLDVRLRKPRDLLSRAALILGKQKIRYFPEPAPLCTLHEDLDPRVVHNLMLMVANECTLRSDKYRHACRYPRPQSDHVPLPMEVEAWIDRLDRITAMRMGGPHGFDQVLGYIPRAQLSRRMRGCNCEACFLAYIGGSDRILADLWASVTLRENAYRTHHRGRDPRLGRIIEAWCHHHDAESVKHIQSLRDQLLPFLEEARRVIVEHQRIQDESTRRAGKHSKKHKHSHRSRSKKQGASSSSSHHPRKSTQARREHADTEARQQSDRGMTGKDTTSSTGTSKACPMTDWPSPFEFQVVENEGVIIHAPLSHSPLSKDGGEGDDAPVSPLTAEGEPNIDRFEDQRGPYDSQSHRKYAFVDDDDNFDEYDDEDEEEAAAEAWLNQRADLLDSTERVNLAQALPAFSAFDAPSAVPDSLHPAHLYVQDEEGNEASSWCSATVHTYMPKRGPSESMPRPASSHYTSSPRRSRYGTGETVLSRDPPVPWEQWEKRFVHEDTLARLEGR